MNATAKNDSSLKRNRPSSTTSKNKKSSSFGKELSRFLLFLFALYTLTCSLFPEGTGALGALIRSFLLIMLGSFGAVLVPAMFAIILFFGKRLRLNGVMGRKLILASLSALCGISAIHLITGGIPEGDNIFLVISDLWVNGVEGVGSGMLGGLVAMAVGKALGRVSATVLLILVSLISLSFAVGSHGTGIWALLGDLLCIERAPDRNHRSPKWKKQKVEATSEAEDPLNKLLTEASDITSGSADGELILGSDYTPFKPSLDDSSHSASDITYAYGDSPDHPTPETERSEYDSYSDVVTSPITAEEYPEPSEAVLSPLYDTEDKPTVAESISEDEPATDEEETDINEDSDPFEEERTVAKGIMKFGRLSGKRPTRTFASISDTANAEPEPPKPTAVESGEPPKPTEEATDNVKKWTKGDKYAYPPTTLLNPIPEKNRITEEEVKAVAQKILNKLSSLKVKASLVGYSIGPTITRYELAPGEGVRVNKISQLIDDISLELASDGVRIEAPIPGKAAVGIEVPNKNVSLVSFRELAEDPRFVKAASKITVCVGQNLTGGAEFMDIDDMPHVLIAGQTKSGKSVAINCMILSFLFRVSPDEVKLILIDPKRVEFNIYSKLPHLVMPVIDEPTKAAAALSWAVKEMERRYDVMKEYDARYREEYLMKTASIPDRDEFPQIVIIIDELADLMLQVRDQVDPLINRLAAKARACGIHLLVGTQRPSADVLTGLIKANIPGRISFKVAEQVDARIIGAAGAEKLLGKGDMLYRPTGKATVRVQGAYVDGIEINKVIDYVLEKNGQADFDPDVIAQLEEEEKSMLKIKKRSGAADDDGDGDREKKVDPLLMNAIEIAVENQSISTSSLQRFLEVGYGRGAKLIDSMERLGIVGPPNGSKPREVYMDMEQFSVWKLEQRFD